MTPLLGLGVSIEGAQSTLEGAELTAERSVLFFAVDEALVHALDRRHRHVAPGGKIVRSVFHSPNAAEKSWRSVDDAATGIGLRRVLFFGFFSTVGERRRL